MDDWTADLEVDVICSDDDSTRRGKSLKLPLVKPVCAKRKSGYGFHQSCRMCLEKIREAMLHHRWQEAAEYMACCSQILECKSEYRVPPNKVLIRRISTEILHHHPNTTMEDYNVVYERMKHSGFKHYLMISLEHAFHLMLHGKIKDAKQKLCDAEGWKYGKESAIQIQNTRLIQAYRSLLDYIIWCDTKSSLSNKDYFDMQNALNSFRKASVNLKEILKHPGVWDPFILSYVDMLEFYQDHDEALKVLTDYALDENFPPNPNAQVYLYRYLKQHDAPQKKQMKNLHSLVPSHELMLDYISYLLQAEKKASAQKALAVILEMLDFACWRTNLDLWRSLQGVIQKLQMEDNFESIVRETMASRKDWWYALHFTSFHGRKDSKENPELLEVKASLAKILCPDRELKYAAE
ncbi:TATA box-binding protein-associated factor RNA polymerase I subunit A isoform X2 [Cololabis saira]|uniref:TATA box-binding protein-associated factor RNA polymerase I subunit A isoform X2 n=1 Tax=Cololabis saira TaxID=129043 RepID=UPI002AD2867C|nr:TATA box-binding protein-associated factor RNA polymerase I subunit A isoform X2 [Cololabis saira]